MAFGFPKFGQNKILRLGKLTGSFLYLLVFLLLLLVGYPMVLGDRANSVVFDMLVLGVILSGVYTVIRERRLLLIAVLLAIPAIASRWLAHLTDNEGLVLFGLFSTALFFIYNSVTMLIYILRGRTVTADTIFGAISVYLMIGLAWAFLFALVDKTTPGSFATIQQVAPLDDGRLPFLVYYSFVSLTTLGYGDIFPVSPPARVLSYMEAVVGQIYLTVLVARLVGLHIAGLGRDGWGK
jgi:hypothetical protein